MPLQKFIDLTNLKPAATIKDITELCELAMVYNYYSVCVASSRVKYACELLNKSDVKVCAVIGFPLGAESTSVKVAEATLAKNDGADELDMVINIGKLLDGDYGYVLDEINAVADIGLLTKVIIETCYLTVADIAVISRIVSCSRAAFIKTSTGFGTAGATLENIAIMRANVGNKKGIKAAGGIRDINTAMAMFKAGADRVGTSAIYGELFECSDEEREAMLQLYREIVNREKNLTCQKTINALPLRLS